MLALQIQTKTGVNIITGICLLLCSYVLIGVYFLSDYFIVDATIGLGLLLLPFVLIIQKETYSYRYLLPATIFLCLLLSLQIKTMLFLSLLFGSLFLIESSIGKINNAFLFLLLLLSPIFNFFNNMICFPVRLWLSSAAGKILNLILEDVTVAGNIIIIKGSDFSVDTACAGLKMLQISFIITLFIITFYQRKLQKQNSSFMIIGLLIFTFVLNIICNLFRIILLVLFQIMPDNYFHDVIGMLCLIVYVVIPLLFLLKRVISMQSSSRISQKGSLISPTIVLNILLIGLIGMGACNVTRESEKFLKMKKYTLTGYDRTMLPSGIQKFENKAALIYIKPLCFYSAEHNPMICWRGSGYDFKSIAKEKVNGTEIYTGLLEKETDKIYTAWWFDNGKCKTIEQVDWRWKTLKGEKDFVLINLNATTKSGLMDLTKRFLEIDINEH